MAEYQKKKVKKLHAQKPKQRTVAEGYRVTSLGETPRFDDIPVKSSEQSRVERRSLKKKEKYLSRETPKKRIVNPTKSPGELNRSTPTFKIIAGTKKAKLIRRISLAVVGVALIISVIVAETTLPTGLVESIDNSFARMGKGSGFPISVNGDSVNDIDTYADCISVLTDTHLDVYNKNSKEVLSLQHNMARPAMSTSAARLLLFDRGSTAVSVCNLKDKLFSRDMKENIVTAAIGRDGKFGVATLPENRSSKLYSYSKDNTQSFQKEFETGIITSLSVSDSGKSMGVVLTAAEGGRAVSTIYVFSTADGKELYKTHKSEAFSAIYPTKQGHIAVSENASVYIDEKEAQEKTVYSGHITFATERSEVGFANVMGTQSSDDGVSCEIFDKNLESVFKSELSGAPKKIDLTQEYFAVAKDTYIDIYPIEGGKKKKIELGFNTEKFVLLGDRVFIINNNHLTMHEINSKESEDKK